MTPEDRDDIRARATIQIMAAMYVNHIHRAAPRDETAAQKESRTRRENEHRMYLALEAASAADAALAELLAREESQGDEATGGPQWAGLPPEVLAMHPGGVPEGAHVLSCKHGRASFEECEQCDAEDAAAKDGENGENRQI